MKNSTFPINQKCFLLLLLLCITKTLVFSQTIVEIEPRHLAALFPERFLYMENNQTGRVTIVERIDSVMCNEITIGYIFYYKPKGFAIVPKIREINPLFAFSGRTLDESDMSNHETFLKEELERRYLAILYKEISLTSIHRNEKMWEQFFLTNSSF